MSVVIYDDTISVKEQRGSTYGGCHAIHPLPLKQCWYASTANLMIDSVCNSESQH